MMLAARPTLLSCAVALLAGSAGSQSSTLILDIKPDDPGSPATLSSYPSRFTPLGDRVVFRAGIEGGGGLWISDGTTAGTTLVAAFENGDPAYLQRFGERVVFTSRYEGGVGLWVSDGTSAGTEFVAHLVSNGGAGPIGVLEDRFVVYVRENGGSRSLWVSDGTPAGTEHLVDIGLMPLGAEFGRYDGHLWFTHSGGAPGAGNTLWKTDGTVAGTSHVSGDCFLPEDFVVAGDLLYFSATSGPFGQELWKTDGTTAGTGLVADIVVGADGGDPHDMTAMDDGSLLFTAKSGFALRSLFRTDGTPTGTVPIVSADVAVGPGAHGVVGFGDVAWFFLAPWFSTQQLWETDGTVDGTHYLMDLAWDADVHTPVRMGSGRSMVLRVDSVADGAEPYVSDGTPDGTVLVSDVYPGPDPSIASGFTSAGSHVFFGADDGVHGYELHGFPVADWGGWVAEPVSSGCGIAAAPELGLAGAAVTGADVAFELASGHAAAPVLLFYSTGLLFPPGGGCLFDLADLVLLTFGVTGVGGDLQLPITIPDQPALVGLSVFTQALVGAAGGPFVGIGELSGTLQLVLGQ